jgi:hypothetical protein
MISPCFAAEQLLAPYHASLCFHSLLYAMYLFVFAHALISTLYRSKSILQTCPSFEEQLQALMGSTWIEKWRAQPLMELNLIDVAFMDEQFKSAGLAEFAFPPPIDNFLT